jgi:hypothetical protein
MTLIVTLLEVPPGGFLARRILSFRWLPDRRANAQLRATDVVMSELQSVAPCPLYP